MGIGSTFQTFVNSERPYLARASLWLLPLDGRVHFLVHSVTAEVASSSLVVPAIHSKRVERISLKPSRTQKGTFSCPYLCPFSSRSICPHSAASFGSDGCDVPFASPENTSEKIAA